jgi:hypothetical protein
MNEKRFTFNDLDAHMVNRNVFKAMVDRLQKEIKVQSGKLEQLQKELLHSEALLIKEERLLKDILTDVTK